MSGYKSSGGKMIDSELGPIPEGWRVGILNDVVEITSGKRPKEISDIKTSLYRYPLIGASKIMGYVSEWLFDEKIIVIGRVGTHGVIQRFSLPTWPSDNTLVFKSDYYNYSYQILNNVNFSELNRGSTQPLITQTDMKNIRILIPDNECLVFYETVTNSIFDKIEINNKESQTLSTLRDTLLPKLMSGELRVPEEIVKRYEEAVSK
jgi:type I restriction enzyme S subunit